MIYRSCKPFQKFALSKLRFPPFQALCMTTIPMRQLSSECSRDLRGSCNHMENTRSTTYIIDLKPHTRYSTGHRFKHQLPSSYSLALSHITSIVPPDAYSSTHPYGSQKFPNLDANAYTAFTFHHWRRDRLLICTFDLALTVAGQSSHQRSHPEARILIPSSPLRRHTRGIKSNCDKKYHDRIQSTSKEPVWLPGRCIQSTCSNIKHFENLFHLSRNWES